MITKDCTVLLYSRTDAIHFLNNVKKLNFKKIYPLTPDAYAEIKNSFPKKNIILPDEHFNKSHHKKTVKRVKIFQKTLKYKFNKGLISDYSLEIIEHLAHIASSSAYYIWYSICDHGPWLVLTKNKWKYINDANIAFNNFYQNTLMTTQPFFFGQIPNYTQRFPNIINFLNNISLKIFKTKNSIWFTGNQYRLNEIANEFINKDKNLTVYILRPLNKYSIIKSILHFIKNLFKFLFNIRIKTIYLTPLIIKHKSSKKIIAKILNLNNDTRLSLVSDIIEDNIFAAISFVESIEQSVNNFIKISKPRRLIAHQLKFGDAIVLGSTFKRKKIPVTLITHGSHPKNNDQFARFELEDNLKGMLDSKFATKTLIQSKVAYYTATTKSYNIKKNKLILSQPLMWGSSKDFNSKKKNKIFTILHAGTPKPLGSRPLIYETSFEYFKSISFLANTVSKIKNVKLIIRFRSAKEFNINSLKKIMPRYSNVEIKFDGNFYDDLNNSDMLISYASTTTEESLYAHKPVGLLGLDNRFWHLKGSDKPPTRRKRSAVYHLNRDNLRSMLISIKKYHQNSLLNKNELADYTWDEKIPGLEEYVNNELSK